MVAVGELAEIAFVDDHAHTRVSCRVLARNRHRSIGRGIVDDDQFEVRIRLNEHALDGFGDVRLAVEGRHHDRYGRGVCRHRDRRASERIALTAVFGSQRRSRRLPYGKRLRAGRGRRNS